MFSASQVHCVRGIALSSPFPLFAPKPINQYLFAVFDSSIEYPYQFFYRGGATSISDGIFMSTMET